MQEVKSKTMADTIESKKIYRNCVFLSINQEKIVDCVFQNCSFKAKMKLITLENCLFQDCRFAYLSIKNQKDSILMNNKGEIFLHEFEYMGKEKYTCNDLTNDIEIYEEQVTGMRFVLVPGELS